MNVFRIRLNGWAEVECETFLPSCRVADPRRTITRIVFGREYATAGDYKVARHRYFSDAAKSRSPCVASTEARIFVSRAVSKKRANGIGTLFACVFLSLSSDSCTSGSL